MLAEQMRLSVLLQINKKVEYFFNVSAINSCHSTGSVEIISNVNVMPKPSQAEPILNSHL